MEKIDYLILKYSNLKYLYILYKMGKLPNTDEKTLNIKESSSDSEKRENIKLTLENNLINTANINTSNKNTINTIHTNKLKSKTKKTGCNQCGKHKRRKIKLILFDCRCGHKFCNECLLPEKHNCDFDYKKMGKEILEKHNPRVEYEKIIPI
jgi:hypothetical protein